MRRRGRASTRSRLSGSNNRYVAAFFVRLSVVLHDFLIVIAHSAHDSSAESAGASKLKCVMRAVHFSERAPRVFGSHFGDLAAGACLPLCSPRHAAFSNAPDKSACTKRNLSTRR